MLPTLFAAGIVFAPLGGLFIYESDTVNLLLKALPIPNHALDSSGCFQLHFRSTRSLLTIQTASLRRPNKLPCPKINTATNSQQTIRQAREGELFVEEREREYADPERMI